jgi:RNA polymerase sigma-70 factor (ECF subfamily)
MSNSGMRDVGPADERGAIFERHRPRLFGIAYRMLGSVEDAEDVVQDAYLRWHHAELIALRSAEAWLVTVVTRLAIDRRRRMATEREAYEGHWLPEPLATSTAPPADQHAELASDLSIAFLVLLERLAPEERAALLLREVFGTDYAEIARALDRSEAACRQIVHRARRRVRSEKRRAQASPESKQHLVERFVAALTTEDEHALLALFAEDVVLVADGGGKVPAVREAIQGAERVARMAVGYQRVGRELLTHRVAWINGEPAVLTLVGDRTLFTTSFALDGDRISAVYRVLNPDKLQRVGPPPYGDWRR